MAECVHRYAISSVEPRGRSRTVWLTCSLCGDVLTRVTNRTDAEIATELAAQ
jgi:hypothetical protein